MIRQTSLHNGIRVVTEQVASYHSVAIGLWVMFGSRHERPEERGVSHLLEHMMFKGTSTRSAADIADEIDAVGGSLNAFTGREFCCFHAKVLHENLPLAVDLLTDMFCHPRLDEVDLDKERRVVLQELARLQDTPEDYIHELFARTLWQGHPLGCSSSGEVGVLSSVTSEQLLEYMQQHFVGSRLLVCAAGKVDHDRLVELVEEKLGGVPEGGPASFDPPPPATRNIGLTRRESEHQHLCLGVRAVSQRDPDRFAMFLLDSILGSSKSSRLFQAVRERHGLAYSIFSYPTCYADGGAMVIYCGCGRENLAAVTELILSEIRGLLTDAVSEAELRKACQQLRGNLLLSLENVSNRMSRLAKGTIYLGSPPDIEDILRRFARVDSRQLRDFAGSVFSSDRLNLHLLGDVSLDLDLRKLGLAI